MKKKKERVKRSRSEGAEVTGSEVIIDIIYGKKLCEGEKSKGQKVMVGGCRSGRVQDDKNIERIL